MRGKLDCYGLTDIGCKRSSNQDHFLIADLTKSMKLHQTSLTLGNDSRLCGGSQGTLFLVADGMGGHAGGERASQLTAESIASYMLNTMPWFYRLDKEHECDYREELEQALARCQRQLKLAADAEPDYRDMGTTLTIAFLIWPRLFVVHAGDSRCYLFRKSDLRQVTTDHTVAQQIVDGGGGTAEEFENTVWANTLWNFVAGNGHSLEPEVHKAKLQMGDTLLLCTDGLTKHVAHDFLIEVLASELSASEVCHTLLEEAKSQGGSDNITVIAGRFRSSDSIDDASAVPEAIEEPVADPAADTVVMLPDAATG